MEEMDRKSKERKGKRDAEFLTDVINTCINHVKNHYRIYKISDQQADEILEVERKKKALERKIKKISSDPNKKKAGLADLNYSQENYAKNQLKLSANQSLKDYVRSAKTPEERRQREDEIRTLLNKYEQESTKTRALTSIIGVLLIGSIIGLIIYLVKRNKNK
ncbi:14121_t:CDS:2 [Funneliformis geosporum]|nr:14121_t:CDS:2 [Funneliformis geosporum]